MLEMFWLTGKLLASLEWGCPTIYLLRQLGGQLFGWLVGWLVSWVSRQVGRQVCRLLRHQLVTDCSSKKQNLISHTELKEKPKLCLPTRLYMKNTAVRCFMFIMLIIGQYISILIYSNQLIKLYYTILYYTSILIFNIDNVH